MSPLDGLGIATGRRSARDRLPRLGAEEPCCVVSVKMRTAVAETFLEACGVQGPLTDRDEGPVLLEKRGGKTPGRSQSACRWGTNSSPPEHSEKHGNHQDSKNPPFDLRARVAAE